MDTPRVTLHDRTQVYPDHKEIIQEGPRKGQQRDYVVLAEEEIAKGYVRPFRDRYVHQRCGGETAIATTIAQTYARDPYFYSGTYCCNCRAHFPVGEDGEFYWSGTAEKVET